MALFVQFQRKTKQRIGNQFSTMHIPASVLLAMLPLKYIVGEQAVASFDDDKMPELGKFVLDDHENDDEDEEEEAEATNFTAEVHANFFKEVFTKVQVRHESMASLPGKLVALYRYLINSLIFEKGC